MFVWCAALIYIAFQIITIVGLRRLPRTKIIEDDAKLPTASIIVAARDEEKRIGLLLDSLEALDYPRDKFEVIIVNDRSTDRTEEIIRTRRQNGIDYRIVTIKDGETPKGRSPKKYALSRGISFAHNDVIVTTDADCWMGPRWLRTLLSPFVNPKVQGATGVSRFVRREGQIKPWWSDFESLEHLSYSVMAAGTLGAGHVVNAHGSNLAARRSVYDRVGGYGSNDRVASGDDVFLLQDVAKNGGKVVFVERLEAYVYSQPVDTIREWVNQRARWSSKGFYYPPYLSMLLVGTFAFYAGAAASLPLAFFGRIRAMLMLLLVGVKILGETLMMTRGAKLFGEKISIAKFIFTQLLHGPAILYAGIRGQFFSFTWKGQKFGGLDAIKPEKQQQTRKAA